MRFGTTKPPSSPSKLPTTPDTGIFAVACTLQSHLHAIEQRFLSGRETNDSLKRRKNELTEVLRLFRIVEENEVALSSELEEEVEVAVRECGLGYEDAAEIRLDPGADVEVIMERSLRRMRVRAADDKENTHSSPTNGKPPSVGIFKPRVAIPPRWKRVIALSASASSSKAASTSRTGSTSATTTTLTGTLSGTLSGTGTTTLGTPPLSLSTLPQTPDTASISSSSSTTGGLCGSLNIRTTYSKSTTKSKVKVKSTMSKKNFKLNRRRPSSSGSETTSKPYKTRTNKRSRSASLRREAVLVVHYKATTPGSGSSSVAGSSTEGVGSSGAHTGRGGLGGGGMWNASRTVDAGAGANVTGIEGGFHFVM